MTTELWCWSARMSQASGVILRKVPSILTVGQTHWTAGRHESCTLSPQNLLAQRSSPSAARLIVHSTLGHLPPGASFNHPLVSSCTTRAGCSLRSAGQSTCPNKSKQAPAKTPAPPAPHPAKPPAQSGPSIMAMTSRPVRPTSTAQPEQIVSPKAAARAAPARCIRAIGHRLKQPTT